MRRVHVRGKGLVVAPPLVDHEHVRAFGTMEHAGGAARFLPALLHQRGQRLVQCLGAPRIGPHMDGLGDIHRQKSTRSATP
jgi:hypothetical protein